MDRISSISQRSSVDCIVVAGDVYHSRSISHEERQLFSSWLGSLKVPTLVISGNHDKRSVEVGDTNLGYLSSFPSLSQHLVYDGPPDVKRFCDCTFILLPYQGWDRAEASILLEVLLERATTEFRPPWVVVMHEAIYGAKTDQGMDLSKPTQIKIKPKLAKKATYWALGDIHMMQSLQPNAWYSGAPHQTNFGEALPKGVLIVDTKKPSNPKFVEISSQPLLVLEELPSTIQEDAYIQLRPKHPLFDKDLPSNVILHPTAHLAPLNLTSKSYGLFDQLTSLLKAQGLTPKQLKLAWRLVKKTGSIFDTPVRIPKPYR